MKVVAFAAKSDPIARRKELTLAELENIPIIVRSNGGSESTTQSLLRTLIKPGQKLNIAMACESPEAKAGRESEIRNRLFCITTPSGIRSKEAALR